MLKAALPCEVHLLFLDDPKPNKEEKICNPSRGVLPVLSYLRMQESPFHYTAEGDSCIRRGDRIP